MLEDAVENPVGDLHGGGQHDGHVLQRHLVQLLLLDDVAHVDKNPLDEPEVGFRQFLQQAPQALQPLERHLPLAHLLEAGDELLGEDGVGQLPEEELEEAGHHGRVGRAQDHGLAGAVGRPQLDYLGLDPAGPEQGGGEGRGVVLSLPVDALHVEAVLLDKVDTFPHHHRQLDAVVTPEQLKGLEQGSSENISEPPSLPNRKSKTLM